MSLIAEPVSRAQRIYHFTGNAYTGSGQADLTLKLHNATASNEIVRIVTWSGRVVVPLRNKISGAIARRMDALFCLQDEAPVLVSPRSSLGRQVALLVPSTNPKLEQFPAGYTWVGRCCGLDQLLRHSSPADKDSATWAAVIRDQACRGG